MVKDPRAEKDYPPQVRDLLSRGQKFETGTGGVVEYRETTKGREPDGRTSYVAKFDVIHDDGDAGFVFGASYTKTEYLALHAIETGALDPVEV